MAVDSADDSKGDKLALRFAQILAKLYSGQQLDKHDLAAHFGVSVRTIERDLSHRLAGYVEKNEAGKWQLNHGPRTIDLTLLLRYAQLVGTDKLYPDNESAIQQAKLDKRKRVTEVKRIETERTARKLEFDQLTSACEKHQICTFVYSNKPRHAEPYKLLSHDGVWYLAAEEGGKLKVFALDKMASLAVNEAQFFEPKKAHFEFIEKKQDMWFTEETTEVELRVAAEVASYFERKHLLPEQNHRRASDGSLLVFAKINHVQQLLPVVRFWLPHVRIVKPRNLHDDLVKGLEAALETWRGT